MSAGAPAPGPAAGGGPAASWPRMAVATLALAGLLISAYLLLHRLGLVGRLICGAEGSCETVQSSSYAEFLGVPVAGIGLVGYLVMMAVALAGLQPQLAGVRRVSLVLLALSLPAVAFTIYLNALEAFVIHAWCRWCIASATIVTLIFLASLADLVLGHRPAADRRLT